MKANNFEIFDHTADIGVKAYGKDPREIFINAACAMFSIIADTAGIKPKIKRDIAVEAGKYDELLAAWLSELLYQYSTSGIIFTKFDIAELNSGYVRAAVFGEKSPAKIKSEIKAVTYHELEFKQTPRGYEAKVIFDV